MSEITGVPHHTRDDIIIMCNHHVSKYGIVSIQIIMCHAIQVQCACGRICDDALYCVIYML